MKIGILGAGHMGQTLARLFVAAGHEVYLANRRGPEALAPLIAELGPAARAIRADELGAFSDLIVLAVRWPQIPAAISALGPVPGKVILDTTNNRTGPRPEDVVNLGAQGSSEVVAGWLPGARVVKIFNNQPISALAELAASGAAEPKAIFLAGDDDAAKAMVCELVRSLGAVPLDTGGLVAGGRLQNTGGGPLAGHGRLLSWTEARAALQQAVAPAEPPRDAPR